MTFYYNIHNPADVRELSEQMAIWQATGNPKQYEWKEQPPQPSPNSQWIEGQWVIPPPPVYTAGEWLEMVGYGADQKPTLLYLKLQLQSVNKSSTKLNETEIYLNDILERFSLDPTPKSDWSNPPHQYHDVVQECIKILKNQN